MPKITLYVRNDLSVRMKGEECNWSKLFAEAVESWLRDPCPGLRLGFREIERILHDLEDRGLLSRRQMDLLATEQPAANAVAGATPTGNAVGGSETEKPKERR